MHTFKPQQPVFLAPLKTQRFLTQDDIFAAAEVTEKQEWEIRQDLANSRARLFGATGG